MKKAVLFALIALLGGLALGTLFGSGISSASLNSVRATAAEYPAVSALDAIEVEGRSTLYQAAPADAGTSCLSDRAGQVLAALKESDYEALAALVHPEKGVTLTPYSTVEPSCDRNLLPAQLVLLPEDDIPYVWGIEDGTGATIELTGREYFERYVFNADYTAAPETAVDTVLMQGNALENVASAYPEGRFVEYHFPGLDEQMAGYDWCSLKLVFECYQGDWYLVGLVHSEWTV